MIRIVVTCLSFVIIFTSCRKDILVEEKFEFPNSQWISGDAKSLTISAPDTSDVYNMEIELTHADDYSFQNLYVRLSTIFPSGKADTSVTSLELANPNGSWAGNCNGDKCSLVLPLQTRFTFPEEGKYQWQIAPYMRKDTIEGIRSLTVRCKKIKL